MKDNFLPKSPRKPVGVKWEQVLCYVKNCKSTIKLKFTPVYKAYTYTYRSSGMVLIASVWKFAYKMRKLYKVWRTKIREEEMS